MTTDPFNTHRDLLFTIAYELLGSAADAEDVLQEAWLRWSRVEAAAVVDARAYLVQVVTRVALNQLRTQARRREDYVGEWLPEPVSTSPDVADDVELAEAVSMAVVQVLETLTPTERAVFVLRDVFDVAYEDIAAAVDKAPAAVRQIAHRARQHVAARRPRVTVDPVQGRQAVDRFMTAIAEGDLQGLLDVLAPDVVLVADGGGAAQAVRRPIEGREKVARLLSRFRGLDPSATLHATWFNGAPAIRIERGGRLDTAVSVDVRDGRITRVLAVRNPAKLRFAEGPVALSRSAHG